jgi:hypothetical protein
MLQGDTRRTSYIYHGHRGGGRGVGCLCVSVCMCARAKRVGSVRTCKGVRVPLPLEPYAREVNTCHRSWPSLTSFRPLKGMILKKFTNGTPACWLILRIT